MIRGGCAQARWFAYKERGLAGHAHTRLLAVSLCVGLTNPYVATAQKISFGVARFVDLGRRSLAVRSLPMNQGMNPYQAPSTQTLSAQTDRDWKWLLFSFDGRITRGEYWKGSILAGLALGAILLALLIPLGMSGLLKSSDSGAPSILLMAIAVVFAVPFIWLSLAIGVKRWHDRGKSGWWTLIAVVPYIGSIWSFVECGCLRGTPGPNPYGPDPLG